MISIYLQNRNNLSNNNASVDTLKQKTLKLDVGEAEKKREII